MRENCSERRAALIAALIAIPAAILIAMLVHYFVAVPAAVPAPSSHGKMPMKPMGGRPMGEPAKMAEREDLTPVYAKRVELADIILKYGQQQFKAGKLSFGDLIPLEVNCRLAEGALYRYSNNIRTRGVSLSDTAVKYDGACRLVKELKARYEAGKESLLSVSRKTDAMLELEVQLKSNRNFRNEAWQKCYEAYCKTPDAKNYKAMLEAEREFPSFRRF
ncbi:MAG: hypothetical protein IJZ19_02705 [Lentisphaeria bacterium]|nr:hypothetical protein [Lentisphaeria bacterium]